MRLLILTSCVICLAAPPAAADPASAEPSAAVGARAAAARAEAFVHLIGETSVRVHVWLRTARARRALRQAACFDEALSRVDSTLRRARDEAAGAHLAADLGDAALAEAHVAALARLREEARAAAGQGAACAAGVATAPVAEGTTVHVIVDRNVAPVEP
jgi:hypothetical protein